MRRILVNADRCSGCRLCEMTCSFSHENFFSSRASRVTVVKEDIYGFDLPIFCWHCNPCSALEKCPEKALERKRGFILVNEKKCDRCGTCSETCVIGAIKLHPVYGTPVICDQCGGKPLCVMRCPTRALAYVEVEKQQPKLSNQILEETLRRWGIIV